MSRAVGVAVTNAARTMSTTGSLAPKELFVDSDLSERYAKYRPKLPVEHVETVVELLGRRPELWLDVGCGPGNSTQRMIGYSDKILGVDVSHTQIDVANKTIIHPSISFIQGSCEKLPADDCSVDVVTAVQAAHFFDLPAFFKEVDRVLKPGGVIALMLISLPFCPASDSMNQAMQPVISVIEQYCVPGPYALCKNRYREIVLPYSPRQEYVEEVPTEWSLADFLDHYMTYSMIQRMIREYGYTQEQVREHLYNLMKGAGLSSEDEREVYTWIHPSTLVAACKPGI